MFNEKLLIIFIIIILCCINAGIKISTILIGILGGLIISTILKYKEIKIQSEYFNTSELTKSTDVISNKKSNMSEPPTEYQVEPPTELKPTEYQVEPKTEPEPEIEIELKPTVKKEIKIDEQVIKKLELEILKEVEDVLTKKDNFDKFKDYPGSIDMNETYKPVRCLTDDLIDGDEIISYLNIHRNEPTRVINGMTNAYTKLNRYVRDEIDEEEQNKEWWGQHDY